MTRDTIHIHVKGGVIQDITGIPKWTNVVVIDRDIEGVEEDQLTKVDGRDAIVSTWKREEV